MSKNGDKRSDQKPQSETNYVSTNMRVNTGHNKETDAKQECDFYTS